MAITKEVKAQLDALGMTEAMFKPGALETPAGIQLLGTLAKAASYQKDMADVFDKNGSMPSAIDELEDAAERFQRAAKNIGPLLKSDGLGKGILDARIAKNQKDITENNNRDENLLGRVGEVSTWRLNSINPFNDEPVWVPDQLYDTYRRAMETRGELMKAEEGDKKIQFDDTYLTQPQYAAAYTEVVKKKLNDPNDKETQKFLADFVKSGATYEGKKVKDVAELKELILRDAFNTAWTEFGKESKSGAYMYMGINWDISRRSNGETVDSVSIRDILRTEQFKAMGIGTDTGGTNYPSLNPPTGIQVGSNNNPLNLSAKAQQEVAAAAQLQKKNPNEMAVANNQNQENNNLGRTI